MGGLAEADDFAGEFYADCLGGEDAPWGGLVRVLDIKEENKACG